jgi:hypothetical protein
MRRIARQVFVEEKIDSGKGPIASASVVDDVTREAISRYQIISHKPWLTRRETAIYLGVSERSIAEWSARPDDQNRFPESNAGGEPRYRREQVDRWAEAENARQRLKREK